NNGGSNRMGEKSRVCRRLFNDENDGEENTTGEIDNLENLIKEELQRDREAAMRRWNFDFENEVPLPGRWVWEREPPADVPPENPQRFPPMRDKLLRMKTYRYQKHKIITKIHRYTSQINYLHCTFLYTYSLFLF
ncbi:hypothetical protein L9F63_001054, partial [Diploptera punctata]